MRVFLILLFTVLFFSCEKREIDTYQTDMGYDYFPITVGQYRTYAVDSVVYQKVGAPDTIFSQIKETIVEQLQDGDYSKYRVLREWRATENDAWQTNTVWWIIKENNRIIQTEENLKFIKLTFPVKANIAWDGNGFFDKRTIVKVGNENLEFFKEWDYRVIGIGAETINGSDYADVVQVEEADFETSIELRTSVAKYAKGIGLIERRQKILDTQCITCVTNWTEKAEKGVILTQTLIDHN